MNAVNQHAVSGGRTRMHKGHTTAEVSCQSRQDADQGRVEDLPQNNLLAVIALRVARTLDVDLAQLLEPARVQLIRHMGTHGLRKNVEEQQIRASSPVT